MLRKIFLLVLVLLTSVAQATHNRAGEITYNWISGLTYEFKITTYTKESAPADRCDLTIDWGDLGTSTLYRTNGPVGACPSPARMGEVLPGDYKRNVYEGQHTFSAPGIYIVTVEDQNRNSGVNNIPSSVNVPFFIQTVLRINPQLGPNNSVQLLNPPIDDGCVNRIFVHNPSAFDPDGDSLGYQLVNCRGASGVEIVQTYDPSIVQNPVRVDSVNGEFIWDTPQNQGQFNFAILITEYRKGPTGFWEIIGSVTRDMQVDITNCNNNPPFIDPMGPYCVIAGQNLSFPVRADDPDRNTVVLTGTGGPLVVSNPATFIQPITGLAPVTGFFSWNTDCIHVGKQPYTMTFKVKDNAFNSADPDLVGFQSVEIQVIAPAPQNPTVIAQASSLLLQWDTSICIQADGYRIYRKDQFYGYTPDSCETGVPVYTGYKQIAEISSVFTTSYLDSDNLKLGNQYCYMVIAYFDDGSESQASIEVCAQLTQDAPILTKVDVVTSDLINGVIDLAWLPVRELDSAITPSNYAYALFRGLGKNPSSYDSIAFFPSYTDTVFTDSGLNTEEETYTYKVQFYHSGSAGNGYLAGKSSNPASSVFLNARPQDASNLLTFSFNVPWINERFVIYRQNITGQFDSIAEVETSFYLDTALNNGDTYCYRVLAKGAYSGGNIYSPLLNRSQIQCSTPIDTTRPCPPLLSSQFDCKRNDLVLFWENPSDNCPEDIAYYNLYFKPAEDDEFPSSPLVSNINSDFFDNFDGELIGCYAVSAVDDANGDPGGSANESELSNVICLEACPNLELPNVFTPNGDEFNRTFTVVRDENGIPLVNSIDAFDMQVFNRWGQRVYSTQSLDAFVEVGWNGIDENSGQECSEGVYFFVCKYTALSVRSVPEQEIHGSVHLFR